MTVYRHFGLKCAPFEARPDPLFYYAAPSHMEALATMQYTVWASKGCCVVLGESGSGKTLLARMLGRLVGGRTTVLWVHGIAEANEAPVVDIYAPGTFDSTGTGPATSRTTLPEWSQSRPASTSAPLLIIDNADELSLEAWRSVIAPLASESSETRPPNVVLLGLPSLHQMLMTPGLLRLSRRVFRTYVLQALTDDQVREYVDSHISVAGGQGTQIFADDAITELHRLTGGNPGLINQVCDNAMIDAYGEDRQRIDTADVLTAVHTIGGGRFIPQDYRSTLIWRGVSVPMLPPPVTPQRCWPASEIGNGDDSAGGPVLGAHVSPLPAILARASHGVVSTTLADASYAEGHDLPRQLESLENRLARAIDAVRRLSFSGDEECSALHGSGQATTMR